MALSYCSNWGSSATATSLELTTSFTQDHLLTTTDLFAADFHCNNQFPAADYNDCVHDQDQDLFLYYDNNYAINLLPYFSSPSDNLVSLTPDIFPSAADSYDSSYHYLKRRKSFEDCFDNVNANANANAPCFLDGFNVPNSYPAAAPEFLPPPLPEFQVRPPTYAEEGGKKSGGSLSAQSMAARQRRKKITEKTQELGKLVPGGTKMNTAEMFHAASKYVKWLQSQVAILQFMASFQEEVEEEEEEAKKPSELQVLLGSPMIQEKLYSEEKCLVPKKFIEQLANDAHIQSKPLILKDIDRLLLQPKK